MSDENTVIPKSSQEVSASLEEMKRLNAMLLRSNNDLMQYAHVASHDLQEPLRKIQMYASLLNERGVMADADKAMVEKILSSSQRMSLLISDLLAHSTVTRSGKMFRPVNLGHLVDKIIEDFELAINERGAQISIDLLPVIHAQALEMNQLFYNLVDNALKFSDSSRTLQISIRCKKLDAQAVKEYIAEPKIGKTYFDISIHDNGIGFDVKYAAQIFKVFNRLHPKELYPGSGIGLSLCRGIMANHNGTLFVESNPGEGSAFHIIIPE